MLSAYVACWLTASIPSLSFPLQSALGSARLSREPLPFRRFQRMLARQGSVENGWDRRAMRRFAMKLPASVRVPGIPCLFQTQTENISARGIFFYIDRLMTEGARVEVTMDFPPQVTLSDPMQVRFMARVLRVQEESPTRVGVAAMIEEYQFLRPAGTEQASELQPSWSLAQ